MIVVVFSSLTGCINISTCSLGVSMPIAAVIEQEVNISLYSKATSHKSMSTGEKMARVLNFFKDNVAQILVETKAEYLNKWSDLWSKPVTFPLFVCELQGLFHYTDSDLRWTVHPTHSSTLSPEAHILRSLFSSASSAPPMSLMISDWFKI